MTPPSRHFLAQSAPQRRCVHNGHDGLVRLGGASGLLVLLVALVTALVACSPSSPADVAGGDAAVEAVDASLGADGEPSSEERDAGVVTCHALSTTGLSAGTIGGVAEAAPRPSGGVLEDGEYILEKTVLFEAAGLPTVDSSFTRIVLRGGTAQTVHNASPDRSLPDRQTTESWTVSGNTLAIAQTCPTAKTRSLSFTFEKGDAGPAQLVVFGESKGQKSAAYFVKK